MAKTMSITRNNALTCCNAISVSVLLSITFLLAGLSYATPEQGGKSFVCGGQFKDLILPMPIINGLESEGIWGN